MVVDFASVLEDPVAKSIDKQGVVSDVFCNVVDAFRIILRSLYFFGSFCHSRSPGYVVDGESAKQTAFT